MLFFFRLLNIVFFLFLSFAEHTPHFSTTAQQNYQTFQPIDVASFPANNKPEIIYLKDNRTQIYELSNGQIFIKRLDLESNKEFMINLDNIESEIKFKEKSTNVSNIVNDNNPKKEFPVYEWTPLIGRNSYPHKRRGHSSIVLDNYLIYFGGCYLDLKCFNDVYFFNMDTFEWNAQKITGNAPCEREGHIAVLYGAKMYVFGGSSTSGFLNDLFELDLINMIWTQANFGGTSPKGISNHKGVVDNNGRIVVFGGYNDEGYSNDIYFIDLVNRRFIKPIISGLAPQPKEQFSMIYLRSKIWIFGGYTTGSVLNELNLLDLDTLYWIKADSTGNKPPPRQGHAAVKQGKEIYIMGGCNYKLNVCYKDTFLLNTETLFWTKIADEGQTVFTERDGHTANPVGELIVLFGGCKLMDSCSNDIMVLNTNTYCPLNCSLNGVCRNKRCLCYQGYQENDCSIQLQCHLDCSNRGKCQSNGKCACYSGYAGEDCELFIPCPLNCTSNLNGVCKADSTCECFDGFQGEACELDQNNKTKNNSSNASICKNNCNGRGVCNDILGVCICKYGFYGNSCEQNFTNLTNETNTTNHINETKETKNNESITNKNNNTRETNATVETKNNNNTKNLTIKDSKYELASIQQNITQNQTNNNSNDTNQTQINTTSNETMANITNQTQNNSTSNESIDNNTNQTMNNTTNNANETNLTSNGSGIEFKPGQNRSLTAQMFGLTFNKTYVKQQKETYDVKNCENYCNYNGLCANQSCFCRQGFTGSDCSFSKMIDLQRGEKVGNLLILVGASIFFGFLVGCFLLWYLGRETKKEELRGIKEEEEHMDEEENEAR